MRRPIKGVETHPLWCGREIDNAAQQPVAFPRQRHRVFVSVALANIDVESGDAAGIATHAEFNQVPAIPPLVGTGS